MGYYLEKLRQMKRKESPTSVEGISLLENDTTPRIETNTNSQWNLFRIIRLFRTPRWKSLDQGISQSYVG